MNLGGWEIVIILGVLVLLFGAKRLPDMARSIGQSARVLKGEMKGLKSDDAEKTEAASPAVKAEPTPLPPTTPAKAAEPAPEQQTRSGQ
ncbi:Sec-independent protein translocase subunit TatA [Pseudonocardia sp. CA-107938]|uniref:Sec-independent protein translocase subunit TatA n=1 Tax=Pseudonocardia sp. CA-107938 TaxID=3240021 RepID=UPI003D8A5C4A